MQSQDNAVHMLALEAALRELLYVTNELGAAMPAERWAGIADDADLSRWAKAALKSAAVLHDLALARQERDRAGLRP